MEVLHLTPHMGGGVGTVVRGYLDYVHEYSSVNHKVIILDDLNVESKIFLNGLGCEWIDCAYWNIDAIDSLVARADIVLVHWWNHPLLQSLLMNYAFPASRMLMWTHISGTPSPNNFSKFIIEYPDKLIFTTPLSFVAPEIQNLTAKQRREIGWIWSTAGVERLERYKTPASKTEQKTKNIIGYAGNLDYSKLNSQFLEICLSMKDSSGDFVVIGPLTHQFKIDYESIANDVVINITGYIPEEEKFKLMSEFKIFGYPLARHHYATCDQAIQEAMALGAVPVVLNNAMESYMVEHGKTGVVARNMKDYSEHLRHLLKDEKLCNTLSVNAEKYAVEEYSIRKMAEKWDNEFRSILNMPKRNRLSLSKIRGKQLSPNEVFTESLGNHAGVFLAHKNATTEEDKRRSAAQVRCLQALQNWSSPTKSTASHYYRYFKEDEWLKEWSSLTLSSET